jgi:excisionase family DNA binding protein
VQENDLLTVADVAARLKVSQETVRQWLRTEQLRGYNLGGQAGWRIRGSEVERLLADRVGKRPRA